MKKRSIRSIVKYILLIPWRILGLPRTYRAFVRLSETVEAIQHRVDRFESFLPNIQDPRIPEVERRLQDSQNAHFVELERRLQTLEQATGGLGPNLCVAETMMKALAANLRDTRRQADELASNMRIVEATKKQQIGIIDLFHAEARGLAKAVGSLANEVNSLKGNAND